MHCLVRHKVGSYKDWRDAFDDDTEDRSQAGLNLLQMWQEADDGDTVWLLYEVHDRKRAEDYFEGLAQVHARQGGVTSSERHYVNTA